MLKHWKQDKGSAATYEALCGALKHRLVKRQDLAEQFCYIDGKYLIYTHRRGGFVTGVLLHRTARPARRWG